MLWTRYENDPWNPEYSVETYAGTMYCTVARGVGDNWFYYVEAYQWKTEEPVESTDITLRISKIGENLLITVWGFDPVADRMGVQSIDVYWGSTLIFDNVRHYMVGYHPTVGDNYQENGNTTQLTASFNIQDPRGAARYSGSENIG
jgi:hypothetical protein